ncbi:MAG: hypothetical protein ACYC1E_12310 [Propionibacteriaceae bacterium]
MVTYTVHQRKRDLDGRHLGSAVALIVAIAVYVVITGYITHKEQVARAN